MNKWKSLFRIIRLFLFGSLFLYIISCIGYHLVCSQYIVEKSIVLRNQLKYFSLDNIAHTSEPKSIEKWTLEQPVFVDVYTENSEKFLSEFLTKLKEAGWSIEKQDVQKDEIIASNGTYYISISAIYNRKELNDMKNVNKFTHNKWRIFIYYDNFLARHNL